MAEEGRVLDCALLAAQLLLESGAETYRAEESALRICAGFGLNAQAYAIPTGIFLTLEREEEEPLSRMRRLRRRSTNLSSIHRTMQISRDLERGSMPLDEAMAGLKALAAPGRRGKKGLSVVATALSAGFFTALFGGGPLEFFIAVLCGATVQGIGLLLNREDSFHFIISLFGGAICALYGATLAYFVPSVNLDAVIVGSIMPLLPGLAMTNAIRDTMRGDLVSGVARAAEALLIATALAAGVGVVLGLRAWLGITGGSAGMAFSSGIPQLVYEFAICAFATCFFAVLFDAPSRTIPFSAALAGAAWVVYRLTGQGLLSFFVASLLLAVASEILARAHRMPATIFLFCALIPLVPGASLYRTMLYIVEGETVKGLIEGASTLLAMGCMAVAIGLTAMLFKYVRFGGRRREGRKKRNGL